MFVYVLLVLVAIVGIAYLYSPKKTTTVAKKVAQEVSQEVAPVSTPLPESKLAYIAAPEFTPSPAAKPKTSYTLEQVPIMAPRKPIVDAGYPNNSPFFPVNRGWYDIVGQGAKNDYCRFVGDYAPDNLACILSKDNSNSTSKFGDTNNYSTTYKGVNVLDIARKQTPSQ